MCRNGVNLTQFKVSVHQLQQFSEALTRSLKEWQEILKPLGFENLATEAAEAASLAGKTSERIEALLKKATEAEAENSGDATITPL